MAKIKPSNSQTLVVCSLKDRCFAATKVMGLKPITFVKLAPPPKGSGLSLVFYINITPRIFIAKMRGVFAAFVTY